ncbi:MAG: hypothetical protein IKI34_02110 [Eubacterium sp.]|nr:hypothetical protein [Eubacterium sp.]
MLKLAFSNIFLPEKLFESSEAFKTSSPLMNFGVKSKRILSTFESGTTSAALSFSSLFSSLSAFLMLFSLFHCLC